MPNSGAFTSRPIQLSCALQPAPPVPQSTNLSRFMSACNQSNAKVVAGVVPKDLKNGVVRNCTYPLASAWSPRSQHFMNPL